MKKPLLVLASRNLKKSGEIRELLDPYGFQVVSVAEFPQMGEVIEDGDSFAANAAKKASETALTLGQWAIGEDSGLMVDALKGAPGIYSARYSGEGATDARNNAKLLQELANVPPARRGAQYVCHVAVADPEGKIRLSFEETCRGRIADSPAGENGFGYDPYFVIPEYHLSFGQLSPLVKRCLSHRSRAFRQLIPRLLSLFSET
ncbi:MAG: RdgB/HAM1 family non-canonical purine NTP pyrophosphatase [Planctomycetaceae bacterium]